MLWHEQSWPALRQMDKNTPVVVPLGACEQHGHHLPLFVDTIQVSAIAQCVEEALADRILLAPALWIGSSHHHKDYPGTISARPSLYGELIKSIALSILGAGFRRIFFLNGHGGNETPGSQALSELVAEDDGADDSYLVLSSWWRVGGAAMNKLQEKMTTPFVSHACEYETSLMLAIRPDLVSLQKVAEGRPVLDSPFYNFEYDGRVGVYRRYHRLTASGSMGSPSQGTAQKGQSMLDAVAAEVVAFLEDFATWTELPAIGPRGVP